MNDRTQGPWLGVKYSNFRKPFRLRNREHVCVTLLGRLPYPTTSIIAEFGNPPAEIKVKNADKNVGLVILNRPLCGGYEKLKALWKKASVTICVDGGANELRKICVENGNFEWIPQYITGDFDSIKEEVLAYYKDKGTKIIPTPDQDNTDFTKAIQYLFSNCDEQITTVVVVSEFSGLLDQTIGNINTLFITAKMTDKPVIILSSDCLAFLLQPGKHSIDVNNGYEGLKCGLLPIGGKCDSVTTNGLKWNLTDDALEFGGLVSTSNALDGSGVVIIETSHPLVWTMETL